MKRILPVLTILGGVATVLNYAVKPLLALEPKEIYAEAKEYSVKIAGAETGTGTIVKAEDGTYTVLTCWHVVDTSGGSYQAKTIDDRTHQITKIERLPEADLALVTFVSSNDYLAAKFGNSEEAALGIDVYIAAYPDKTHHIPGGYQGERGEILSVSEGAEEGYEFFHSVLLSPGSSGGGLYDSQARLIGINGASVSEGNVNKGYGKAIPAEIYLAARDNFELVTNNARADFFSIGERRLEEKDYEGAIAEFNRALDLNPDDLYAFFNRAAAYNALGEYSAALEDLDRALDIDPELDRAYSSKGIVYSSMGEYDRAVNNFNEAIELNSSSAEAYFGLALINTKQGETPLALTNYTQAIDLDSNYVEAYYGRGLSYRRQGDYERAIADFDEAIRINPEYTLVYLDRGISYFEQQQYEQAIADFSEIIGMNPEDPQAYRRRALSYFKQEDYDRAIADYNKAIPLDPQHLKAYYNRGLSYFRTQNYRRAIDDFERTVDLDPDYADAYYNCGLSYKMEGDYKYALENFNQAAELYWQQGNSEWYERANAQIEQL